MLVSSVCCIILPFSFLFISSKLLSRIRHLFSVQAVIFLLLVLSFSAGLILSVSHVFNFVVCSQKVFRAGHILDSMESKDIALKISLAGNVTLEDLSVFLSVKLESFCLFSVQRII